MRANTVRTTLSLPADLLAAVDEAVREGSVRSRNEFVREALRREIAARRRAAIDADIAEMYRDPEYLAEAEQIMKEFAQADREAWQIGEQEYIEGTRQVGDATR